MIVVLISALAMVNPPVREGGTGCLSAKRTQGYAAAKLLSMLRRGFVLRTIPMAT
jgi:hypothetical protein